MAVTACVLPFSRRLAKLPADRERWRAELDALPTCERSDCSPGGCRKHCADYASGAWIRATAPKPKKGKR